MEVEIGWDRNPMRDHGLIEAVNGWMFPISFFEGMKILSLNMRQNKSNTYTPQD